MVNTDIKSKAPSADTTMRERAALDKIAAKKSKNKGTIKNKYAAFIPGLRMTVYANRKKKLERIVGNLWKQYDFDINEVEYLK